MNTREKAEKFIEYVSDVSKTGFWDEDMARMTSKLAALLDEVRDEAIEQAIQIIGQQYQETIPAIIAKIRSLKTIKPTP